MYLLALNLFLLTFVNSQRVSIEEYPFIVQVRVNFTEYEPEEGKPGIFKPFPREVSSNGVILNKIWILAPAFFPVDGSEIRIWAGGPPESPQTQKRIGIHVIRYPCDKFFPPPLNYANYVNFALIKLDYSLRMGLEVNPVDYIRSLLKGIEEVPIDGAWIVGWSPAGELHKSDVTMSMSREPCPQSVYRPNVHCFRELGRCTPIRPGSPLMVMAQMPEGKSGFLGGITISDQTCSHEGDGYFEVLDITRTVCWLVAENNDLLGCDDALALSEKCQYDLVKGIPREKKRPYGLIQPNATEGKRWRWSSACNLKFKGPLWVSLISILIVL